MPLFELGNSYLDKKTDVISYNSLEKKKNVTNDKITKGIHMSK